MILSYNLFFLDNIRYTLEFYCFPTVFDCCSDRTNNRNPSQNNNIQKKLELTYDR